MTEWIENPSLLTPGPDVGDQKLKNRRARENEVLLLSPGDEELLGHSRNLNQTHRFRRLSDFSWIRVVTPCFQRWQCSFFPSPPLTSPTLPLPCPVKCGLVQLFGPSLGLIQLQNHASDCIQFNRIFLWKRLWVQFSEMGCDFYCNP